MILSQADSGRKFADQCADEKFACQSSLVVEGVKFITGSGVRRSCAQVGLT